MAPLFKSNLVAKSLIYKGRVKKSSQSQGVLATFAPSPLLTAQGWDTLCDFLLLFWTLHIIKRILSLIDKYFLLQQSLICVMLYFLFIFARMLYFITSLGILWKYNISTNINKKYNITQISDCCRRKYSSMGDKKLTSLKIGRLRHIS